MAEQEFGRHHELTALGDFNFGRVCAPRSRPGTCPGLPSAPALNGLPRTIFDEPFDRLVGGTATSA